VRCSKLNKPHILCWWHSVITSLVGIFNIFLSVIHCDSWSWKPQKTKIWCLKKSEFGHRCLQFGHRICCRFSRSCFDIFRPSNQSNSATEVSYGPRIFVSSATDFASSATEFDWAIYRKVRFQNKGSRILRPKAYFGAEALQIWWSAIITHSLSSNSCMNPSFYVSYLLL